MEEEHLSIKGLLEGKGYLLGNIWYLTSFDLDCMSSHLSKIEFHHKYLQNVTQHYYKINTGGCYRPRSSLITMLLRKLVYEPTQLHSAPVG